MINKSFIKYIRLLFLTILLGLFLGAYSQSIQLTLQQTIDLAQKESFAAFKAKNMFKVKSLDFKDYKSDFKPHISLSLTPVNYRRNMTEVWNNDLKRYESVENQRMTSDVNLSLSQSILQTGGKLSIRSNLQRYEKYKEGKTTDLDFVSVPFEVNYSQSLSDIKKYKWKRKIEPLKFKVAQKKLVTDCEDIAGDAVSYFFDLLNAQVNMHLNELSYANADTLLSMGKLRAKIGSISRDNLLNLQLKKVNAQIQLDQSINNLENARLDFCNFLRLPTETQIECIPPQTGYLEFIDPVIAQQIAMENNPDFDDFNNRLLGAEERLYNAKQSRFNLSMNAGIGYNQNTDDFIESYEDLLERQNFKVSMSMPIVSWGETKRRIQKATLNQKLVMEENKYNKNRLLTNIQKRANEFNLRKSELASAALADTIAHSASVATKQRFVLGKVNVIDINESEKALFNARTRYINALRKYWSQYYFMRSICLYDFEKKENLMDQFDEILSE